MRTAWPTGTILETQSGTSYTITSANESGGSAIIYYARANNSSIPAVLKEFFPRNSGSETWSRRNGVPVKDSLLDLAAGDRLLQACYQQLKDLAAQEMKVSQDIAQNTIKVWPFREQLKIVQIREPNGSCWRPEAADPGILPCCILLMDDLNHPDGIWLKDLLEEACFPQSKEHPFGNLQEKSRVSRSVLPLTASLAILQHTLGLLYKLHDAGYLHGDINLGNIFLTLGPGGDSIDGVMVIDFGSARRMTDGRTAVIRSEPIFTTPGFCAPEILKHTLTGEPLQLTAAADVYSAGKLMQFLLNGEAANAYRKGLDLEQRLSKPELSRDKINDSRISPDILHRLNKLLAGAAEEDPKKRSSVQELLNEVIALRNELDAPRYLLAENLSSADFFVKHSRDRELLWLKKSLEANVRPIWIWGIGGIGKTELAKEFGRACKTEHRRVCVCPFSLSVRNSILSLKISNYHYEPNPKLTALENETAEFQERIKILAAYGPDAVFILDNFYSPDRSFDEMRQEPEYQTLLELSGPHLVITTRFCPGGDVPEVSPLSDKDLLTLLRRHDLQTEEPMLRQLIQETNGHTLTLSLIGYLLGNTEHPLSAEQILTALRNGRLSSLRETAVTDKDRTYRSETFFNHLRTLFGLAKIRGAQRRAFCHATILPQAGMKAEIFQCTETPEERAGMQALVEHGWVRLDPEGILTIHPLVRAVAVQELKPEPGHYRVLLESLFPPEMRHDAPGSSIARDDMPFFSRLSSRSPSAECFDLAFRNSSMVSFEKSYWASCAAILYFCTPGSANATQHYQLARQAMILPEVLLPQPCEMLAQYYWNIAFVLMVFGEPEALHSAREEGVEIALKYCRTVAQIPQVSDAKLAKGYEVCGYALLQINAATQAVPCLEKALDYFISQAQPEYLTIAGIFSELGTAYKDANRYPAARQNYQEAIYAMQKAPERNSAEGTAWMSACYRRLCDCCMQLNDLDGAVDAKMREQESDRSREQDAPVNLAEQNLLEIVELYEKAERYADALQRIHHYEKHHGASHSLRLCKAKLWREMKDPGQEYAAYQELFAGFKREPEHFPTWRKASFYYRAAIAAQSRPSGCRPEEVCPLLETCWECLLSSKNLCSPDLLRYGYALSGVYLQLGRKNDALRIEQEMAKHLHLILDVCLDAKDPNTFQDGCFFFSSYRIYQQDHSQVLQPVGKGGMRLDAASFSMLGVRSAMAAYTDLLQEFTECMQRTPPEDYILYRLCCVSLMVTYLRMGDAKNCCAVRQKYLPSEDQKDTNILKDVLGLLHSLFEP